MKRLISFVAASILFTAIPNFALADDTNNSTITPEDHHGPGLDQAANIAFRIADIGENYQRSYRYDLAQAGRNLHMAASDLYYALRNGGGGHLGLAPMNHTGGGAYDALNDRLGDAVQYFVRVAPYYAGSQAQGLYQDLQNALNDCI